MKKLVLALLIIGIVVPTSARMTTIIVGAPTGAAVPTYLLDESFDSAGYDDASWTEGGTPDEDYATAPAPLVGTQSLRISSTGALERSYNTGNSFDTGYGFFRYLVDANATTNDMFILRATTTNQAVISLDSTDNLDVYASGGTGDTDCYTLTEDQNYYIWWYFDNSGGSGNVIFQVWVSESSTKPGVPDCSSTDGTGTTTVNRISFWRAANGDISIIDEVKLDDVAIGSSPP